MFQKCRRTVTVSGISVPVDPDFRIMCEYSRAASQKDPEALMSIAERFYFAGIPEGVTEEGLAEGIQKFYVEGIAPGYDRDNDSGKDKEREDAAPPCFDFDEDESLFLSAFKAEYNIDLTEEKLHWFLFCAYFRGLSEDCRLKRVISIRNTKMSEIKSPEEKARIRKLKNIFALKAQKPKKYANAEKRDADIKKQLEEKLEQVRGGEVKT